MNASLHENACAIGQQAPGSASAREPTCVIELHPALDCLPCILLLLKSLRLMPVHNGGQPLVDVRVAVVLHIGDSQERQRICAARPVFNAVQCPLIVQAVQAGCNLPCRLCDQPVCNLLMWETRMGEAETVKRLIDSSTW